MYVFKVFELSIYFSSEDNRKSNVTALLKWW